MMSIILSSLGFLSLNKILKTYYKNNKIAINSTSFLHAISAVAISGNYLYNPTIFNYDILKSYSSGYFIYDALNILSKWKFNLINVGYIYHHLASIYLLHQDRIIYKPALVVFLAEISNIPAYYVYHYLNTGKNEIKLKFWKKIQKILYCIIRIPIMSKLVYDNFNQSDSKKVHFVIFPVYLMGLIWAFKILKQ